MKKYLVSGLLILCLLFLFIKNNDSAEISLKENINAIEVAGPQKEVPLIPVDESASSSSAASSVTATPVTSVVDLNQSQEIISETETKIEYKDMPSLKDWRAAAGYFSDQELDEYGRLDKNVLEELAKKGDIKAIQTLSDQEAIAGDHERSRDLTYLAAVHGSIESIRTLRSYKTGEYISSKNPKDALEALAYLQVAAKRGDLLAKYDDPEIFYKVQEFYPNEEQQKIIDNRANEIMADLQKRRAELGLGEFDNRPPREQAEFFDRIKKK